MAAAGFAAGAGRDGERPPARGPFDPPRIIGVTAAHHREGVTSTALELARALAAEPDARVVLIEANLRRPALGRMLDRIAAPGLAELLVVGVPLTALPVAIDADRLWLIGAGSRAAAVQCDAIGRALAEASRQFDCAIVDLPPVRAYTDAVLLAPWVGAVVLVAAAERTPFADVEDAARKLEAAGAQCVGVVLARQHPSVPRPVEGRA
ncbi:MAG: hypothetical protein AB7V27_13865 [Candidatus Binatia bacterium]